MNRKGFTLIELLAVVILLAIVMGVTSYAILNVLGGYKEKNYDLLVGEIQSAVETYYQECRYVNNDCSYGADNKINLKLGTLVNNGYLKGNDEDNSMKLVNPKDNVEITNCKIKFDFDSDKGVVVIQNNTSVDENSSCPTTADYSN